jgi:hypothetical protein
MLSQASPINKQLDRIKWLPAAVAARPIGLPPLSGRHDSDGTIG